MNGKELRTLTFFRHFLVIFSQFESNVDLDCIQLP